MNHFDENTAWQVLLRNRMNPSHWHYRSTHRHDANQAQAVHEFKNNSTGDIISIEHTEGVKKKSRLYK